MKDSFTENLERLKADLIKLETKIKVFESLEPLRKYILVTRLNRSCYLVEIRRRIVLDLLELGLSKFDISKVLNKNHATILHAVKTPADPRVEKIVAENYKQWINDNVYPVTVPLIVPSSQHPTGYKTIVDYKLRKLPE
jgi:hypothetical protein